MKILVVSNNCLSFDNNNGKVMRNYLYAFSNDELCNFYISNEKSPVGISSFNVTNNDALKRFVTFGLFKAKKSSASSENVNGSNIKYSPFKHYLRYLVWNSGFWKSRKYKNFIKNEKPERIVTFLGNNPYLLKLSYELSKKLSVPLILFIGEDYPLKNFDYITRKNKMGFWFRRFHKTEKRCFLKASKMADLVIFNSDYIKDAYLEKYAFKKYDIVYHLSSQSHLNNNFDSKVILYAGNMGLGRVDALIDFADVLYNVDKTFMLKVFGNANKIDFDELSKHQNIDYHSFIKNEELIKEYEKAFALIHVEKNDIYNNTDLEFAFSTKIVDMICSKKPFLVYAPSCLACSKHLLKYQEQSIATNREELEIKLKNLLIQKNNNENDDLEKLHNIGNCDYIKKIICEI
ncbi:MAG: hypothetical protein MJ211_12505 [Bacteroidales bacterium]|nr:hypothetical protein [Bacteroidales bacterium]